MSNRGFAKTIGVAVVALVFVGLFFYVAMAPTVRAPDESRRVSFEGFSIVAPEGWLHSTQLASPDGKTGNEIMIQDAKSEFEPGMLRAAELPKAPTEEVLRGNGYAPTEFQGLPAWRRAFTEDKMHGVVYRVFAHGRWYDVRVRRPLSEPIDASWMAYLKSFRPNPTPPETTGHNASLPTVAPTTAPK